MIQGAYLGGLMAEQGKRCPTTSLDVVSFLIGWSQHFLERKKWSVAKPWLHGRSCYTYLDGVKQRVMSLRAKQGVLLMAIHTWSRRVGTLWCAAAGLLIVGCASNYHTANVGGEQKVYRVDHQGGKTLVYETDVQGRITIYDPEDPMAKRQAAAQEVAMKKAEGLDPASSAGKRQPKEPIYVDLAPAELDEQMQKAERAKGAVADQIRSEFVADPIIKLVERNQERSGLLKPHLSAGVDVEVAPKVSLKEAYGIDRKTGKPAKILAVVFEATITSQAPPATYKVSESGYAQRNLEVSKRFAKQVKQVILEKIGPNIPVH